MKKTTLAIVCLLGCTALSLSAQEAEKKQLHEIKVKFDKVPDGLANYYSGYYYYNGKEIYNMRNYLMYTGNRKCTYHQPKRQFVCLHRQQERKEYRRCI